MLVHTLTLPDGTVLDAGTIRSVTLTEQVSDREDLSPGAACAACAEIELWAPENGQTIAQGTEMILTRRNTETGTETQAGIFLAEKPEKVSANVIRVTAYDRMTLLDRNLSPWLREQQGRFPMALSDFVRAVCESCGVALADGAPDSLPNGDYSIQAFYADDITGRQLIQWAAQAAGRFARMTPAGRLEFAWYTESALAGIGPGSGTAWTALNLSGQIFTCAEGEIWTFGQPRTGYLSGGLSYQDYRTAPIDKVQIKQSDDDVGVLYPPDETGTNALVIQGNLLLTTAAAEALRPVAQTIYEIMRKVCYTPLTVNIQAGGSLPEPGQYITVTDAYGRALGMPVMQRTISGQSLTLESTGNASRDGTAAVNQQKWTNLQGKVLELSANVDGLNIKASQLEGGYTQLSQTVDSISLSAQNGTAGSTLTLSANGIVLSSAEVRFSGMVTFADLSGAGRSVINGANLTTGTILSATGFTRLNLDSGIFQVGADGTSYVHIEPGGITWRGVADSDGATSRGQVRTTDTRCYFTSDTRYQYLGWYHEQTGQFEGMEYEQIDNAATFSNRVNVNGVVACRTLLAWDAKERVVRTEYGNLGMSAMESPEPVFLDSGSVTLDGDGLCCILPDPRYAATVSATAALRWYVSPTSPGQIWAEKNGQGVILHGTPGMTADWMCAGIQRGFEGVYADARTDRYPESRYTAGDGLLDASFQRIELPLSIRQLNGMEGLSL